MTNRHDQPGDGEQHVTLMEIAEDDSLRSLHVRRLVQNVAGRGVASGPPIPKVIVQFWHDSGDVPDDVRECLDSWRPLEAEGFEQVLFDDQQARNFINDRFDRDCVDAFDRCRHPAMRSDFFRLCFMTAVGGMYVDADDFYLGTGVTDLTADSSLKLHPLCYDINQGSMVETRTFVEGRRDSPDWIFYVNNNPLISPANHPVMQLALARATRLLLGSRGPYDIQSTTGPGNLTACLVHHAVAQEVAGEVLDFTLLDDWEVRSISRWPLSYRDDSRNWRLWDPSTDPRDAST